ncbi:SDR family oxidoreductase [Pontibacter sp. HSC-36F09]|uniref:SDR family oxidoreductase n=1 Tax=Pontibacter sp. HSC-36F09 TaxID=2910966 RepID=UPI0020A11205|nr:SDR family oxidoreductase [Pontibacter sp. HSC-36F09]MCP2045326.1 NAD(P)H dehydrogenase (quinone) [Pontibacter sp. HSC-36F09]
MKIGITGATGHLGRLIVAKMKEKAATGDLVALVRSPQKAADLGIEAREADYDKPETLQRALDGIDTLLLISGSEVGKRAKQHQHIIDAAKQNGVQRIVYTSLLHADNTSVSLATEHRATEQALKASGIPHTNLRNGWYTENYTGSIPGALAGGAFIGSAGEGRISGATREDYAEAAVAVLTSEGHDGKVYELAGDEAFTLSEFAAELSRQTGREIPYKNLPEVEYAAALASFGIPEEMAKAIAGWDVSVSKGDLFDDSRQLSKLIGRPTTPLSVAVEDALKQAPKAG